MRVSLGGTTRNDVISLSYPVNNRHPHTSLCGEEGLPAVGGARVYSSLCATMEVQSCFIRQQLSAIVIGRVRRLFSGRQGWLMLLAILSGWTPSRE